MTIEKPVALRRVAKSMFTCVADVGLFGPLLMADVDVPENSDRAEDRAMARYASGDDGALAVVYDAVAGRLYAFFLRRCRDVAIAEDLVQQTFLHIHRARGSFVAGSPVLPWAFAIGRRLLIDWARKAQRARQLIVTPAGDEVLDSVDGAANVESIVQARQMEQKLRADLERLPDNQRVAFELLRIDGLSLHDAAETLGITVTALKLRAHRAYKALGLSHGEHS